MNLKGIRVAMYVIAAALLAMTLAGCGGDDDGLSASDMARIASAEQAAVDAQAAAEAAAAAAAMPDPDPAPAEPMGPETGGTLEGQEGRAAAARIAYSASDAGIMGGADIGSISQARLGEDPMLTIAVTGGSGLGTAMDSADMDAPMIDGFTGVSLMKDGPGAVTQMALVYSDAERSVRAWGDAYRYNTNAAGDDLTVKVALTQKVIGHISALGR